MSASFDPLIIDEAAVSTFVEVLFGSLGGFVPVRILAEKGGQEVRTRCYSLAVGLNLGAELAKLAGSPLGKGGPLRRSGDDAGRGTRKGG